MVRKKMKQIVISKYGSPEVLQVRNIEKPTPKADEILIKNHFSGVNFSEVMARMKLYPGAPKPPCTIGGECCGVIEAIGDNINGFSIGQRVMAFSRFQSYASHVCTPVSMVMPLPDKFSLEQGAAFPVVYITAYQMLFDLGNLRAGDTVLIHGAGGGVGTAAIQIAKSLDVKIIGTASKWKHPRLKEMGVDCCIDYQYENVVEKVKSFTNNNGVDIIIDPVGAKNWKMSYECLGIMGKLIIFGDQDLVSGFKLNPFTAIKELWSMPKYKPMSLMSSNKSIMGYHLGRMQGAEEKIARSVVALNKLAKNGYILPIIDKIFPYSDTPSAHRYMQERKNFGKILIDFSQAE
jgi:NADPH:quinone reductase-like Zn-dependent oxidoreductase